jgi:hypothetical protein
MTIQLSFDEDTERYVRLMCTRKGVTLEDYVLGNLEWDDKPDCLVDKVMVKIPKGICWECQWFDKCPDAK